ncbi:MAG: hypothetical protein J0L50_06215 [Sphingomonadales bacterium]|nr:hypothetical protein [Sphingomonadales bacterium]
MKPQRHQRIFADVTAALEDAHDLAVQGQSPDLTTDMIAPISAHIRQGLARINCLMSRLPGAGDQKQS